MQQTEVNLLMIDKHMEAIKHQMENYKNNSSLNKQQQERRINQEFKILQNELEIFELDLTGTSPENQQNYKEKFQVLKNNKSELQKQFKDLQTQIIIQQEQEQLVKQQQIPETRDQLVQWVDIKLQQANANLDDCIVNLAQGRSIMQEVNLEIQKQTERLSEIDQKLEEMYDLTAQSKKLLSYFKRNLATDRLLQGFIVIICLLIIVVIVLKAVGFKGLSQQKAAN